MKKRFKKYAPGTQEYIAFHGRWRISRGHRPSATSTWDKNPKIAFSKSQCGRYLSHYDPYLQGLVPKHYRCARCGADNCKLWRLGYENYGGPHEIICADCAAKDQGVDIKGLDANGTLLQSYGRRGEEIGSFAPAVPTENSLGYWVYGSMPEEAMDWWRQLPTRPTH